MDIKKQLQKGNVKFTVEGITTYCKVIHTFSSFSAT